MSEAPPEAAEQLVGEVAQGGVVMVTGGASPIVVCAGTCSPRARAELRCQEGGLVSYRALE